MAPARRFPPRPRRRAGPGEGSTPRRRRWRAGPGDGEHGKHSTVEAMESRIRMRWALGRRSPSRCCRKSERNHSSRQPLAEPFGWRFDEKGAVGGDFVDADFFFMV